MYVIIIKVILVVSPSEQCELLVQEGFCKLAMYRPQGLLGVEAHHKNFFTEKIKQNDQKSSCGKTDHLLRSENMKYVYKK